MQAALSTGRLVDIAPLTIHEYKQLEATSEALGPKRTWKDAIALVEARLKICHQSTQRAGGKKTLDELERELTVPELDELFYFICELTLQETQRAPAWAHCNSHGRPN